MAGGSVGHHHQCAAIENVATERRIASVYCHLPTTRNYPVKSLKFFASAGHRSVKAHAANSE